MGTGALYIVQNSGANNGDTVLTNGDTALNNGEATCFRV